jgi:hypothetical protein
MISFLVLIILVLACLGYGLLGLRMVSCPDAPSWAESYGRAFALGMGTLGWLVFWFGIAGLLQSWLLCGLLLPGVLSLWFLRQDLRLPSFSDFRYISVMLVVILTVTGFMDLLEAFAPPADADTLAYHFALPKQFLKGGVIQFVPIAVEGAIPLLTHMTYLLALGLGGETSLTLWSFTTQIFMALALYGVGRRWLCREWSLTVVLIFETTPAVIFGGGSGHMEVRTAIFMLLGSVAVAEGIKRRSLGLVFLAGLMAGFFMGSKYLGLFAVIGIVTVIFMQKKFWLPVLIYSGAVLLSGAQWYGWNWYHSGMPVFPTLYHFMGSPETPYWNEAVHHAYQQRALGICVPPNLLWLIWYPFITTFNPETCFNSGRVGLGPFLVMLLPGVLYGLWHYRRKLQESLLFKFSISAVVYYVLWFLIPSDQGIRHLLPIYPIVLLGATIVIYRLALDGYQTWAYMLWRMSATICILMGLGIQSIFTLNYAKYHLNQENRDTFYSRNIGHYNAVQWINENLTSSDRIANPIRYFNYLLEVPYLHMKSSSQILIDTHSLADSERLFNQLIAQRITHLINWGNMSDILVNRNLFHDVKIFNTVCYSSRTLGLPMRSSCRIIRINSEIK